MSEAEVSVISPSGDLILDISQEEDGECFSYRVETRHMRQRSPYFEHLLEGPFSEATEVRLQHGILRQQYLNMEDAPHKSLPHIKVFDIGRISKVTTIKNITADYLRILHAIDLSQPTPPIPNIANLAIVADRFDSLGALSEYTKRKRLLQALDAKTKVKNIPEERVRQKILIGYLLDYGPWVTKNSKYMLLNGSKRWEEAVDEDGEPPLWWDLPHGIEEELHYRRERILETISSIPSYFVAAFSSSERQCKLGYDSSLACDSFQLGEMIRFLSRIGVLRTQSLILNSANATEAYAGELDRLIENLRKCPNYQIDGNHAHCGLRTRMIPVLDWLQYWLDKDSGSPDIGLCLDCFKNRREDYSWSEAKRPLLWRRPGSLSTSGKPRYPSPSGQCSHRQFEVREIFTAVERYWM